MSMFASIVGQLEKKRSKSLDEQLQHLIGQIRLTGKPGKFTVCLTLRPADHDGQLVDVSAKVSVAAPEVASKGMLFFVTDDNLLSRTDPRQHELAFEEVPGGLANHTPATEPVAARNQ